MSFHEATGGRGLCGTAFVPASLHQQRYLTDPRGAAFQRAPQRRHAVRRRLSRCWSATRPSASCSSFRSEKDTFTPEFAELLQRLADNVSFALDNFDRAEEKARTEAQKERLTRMLAALSATNEAIVRAKSRTELFELVCQAASNGGKFTSTTIALVKADSDYLEIVAAAGPSAAARGSSRLSIDAHREGRGMSGTAFRTRQPCVSNDYWPTSV